MESGYVYLLYLGQASAFKIGTTRNPKKRYRAVKKDAKANEYFMIMFDVLCVQEPYYFENFLHQLYSHRRLSGEWFYLQPDEIMHIEEIAGIYYGQENIRHHEGWAHLLDGATFG